MVFFQIADEIKRLNIEMMNPYITGSVEPNPEIVCAGTVEI